MVGSVVCGGGAQAPGMDTARRQRNAPQHVPLLAAKNTAQVCAWHWAPSR